MTVSVSVPEVRPAVARPGRALAVVPAPQAEVSGPVVACWTGRQARALRVAARWSTDQRRRPPEHHR